MATLCCGMESIPGKATSVHIRLAIQQKLHNLAMSLVHSGLYWIAVNASLYVDIGSRVKKKPRCMQMSSHRGCVQSITESSIGIDRGSAVDQKGANMIVASQARRQEWASELAGLFNV